MVEVHTLVLLTVFLWLLMRSHCSLLVLLCLSCSRFCYHISNILYHCIRFHSSKKTNVSNKSNAMLRWLHATIVELILFLFPVDRDTHKYFCRLQSNVLDAVSLFQINHVVHWNTPREDIFFCVASWLFRITWYSFTTCLSSRGKRTALFIVSNASKKPLRTCPDHILSSADKQRSRWQSMALQKHGDPSFYCVFNIYLSCNNNILLFPVDRDTHEFFCRLQSNVFDAASLFQTNHVVHWNAPREDIFFLRRHGFFLLRDVHSPVHNVFIFKRKAYPLFTAPNLSWSYFIFSW